MTLRRMRMIWKWSQSKVLLLLCLLYGLRPWNGCNVYSQKMMDWHQTSEGFVLINLSKISELFDHIRNFTPNVKGWLIDIKSVGFKYQFLFVETFLFTLEILCFIIISQQCWTCIPKFTATRISENSESYSDVFEYLQ